MNNNRLKINLIKERTLQRKNELEGKQNSNQEQSFFNSNKVFSTQNNDNNNEQYYQNFNKFPQNVDNNMINRQQNAVNENYIQPMISDNLSITSPIQTINPYQAFPFKQQPHSQFSSNSSNQVNVKQQRQNAIAKLRRRVEKNSPVESPTNNTFPTNNFRIPLANKEDNVLQNIEYNNGNDSTNIPLLSMSNNEYVYGNIATNQHQQYGNTNFLDGNNIISLQNPIASPTQMNNEVKGKLDNKNPLAILSRRIEKSKMDNQEKNKMEIMDQRKQSLQLLENRTNERIYNNGNNDKGFNLFQNKPNGLYTSPKFSPYLNNSDNNGFPNPSLYPNKVGNIERNDSYSSTSSLTREGSIDIPTSPYDQYPTYSMNSRISSVDSSRISSFMLPDANSISRYSSVSSRYSSSSYMEDPQLFNNEYKSFSPQLYYQQQSTSSSSKSIIPSQRVASLSYSQNDMVNPQLGAIGNPINKVNDKTSSNNSSSSINQSTSPKMSNTSSSSFEPEQNIRQRAIGTLMRRIKNNADGSTSPTSISPPRIYNNNNNTNINNNNNNNLYGTLNQYDHNNTTTTNKNINNEEENNKKHEQIRKNLFAKLNNRINTATKTNENNGFPTDKHSNENSPINSTPNQNFINNANNLTNEEKAQVRKSVMNIIGLRTKKNEMEKEGQNNILTIPLEPFKRKFVCKLKVNQILNLAMAKKRYIFVFNDALFLCKGIKQNNVLKYQIKNVFETKKLRFAIPNDDSILEEQFLSKNPIVKNAVSQFAVNPIKSLRFLFQQKLLHCSSNSIAFFLHCMPGISKRQVGFFIGMPEHNDILEAYINAIPCCNIRLDQSLRFFLKTIKLPSDNDIINRILCCFAKIWHSRNESLVSFDYIMTLKLVFTLISLNAELHPPMSMEALAEYQNEDNMERIKQSFFNRFKNNNNNNDNNNNDNNNNDNNNNDNNNNVNNLNGDDNKENINSFINNDETNDHYDIPLKLLQDMYESIKEEKIEVAPDNVSLLKQNQNNFKVTFSYIPKNQNEINSTMEMEFPTKLYQNEVSGVITVTLPHPNPYIQINIDTQDLKVNPSILTFENSNKAEFTITASKIIGRKLLLFTKRLSKAASQIDMNTQHTILDSYAPIDSKCIKVEPAFMRHSITLETTDNSEGEKTSPLLNGRYNSHSEKTSTNIKKYIFTVDSDQTVQEFIQSTKDYIERASLTSIMNNQRSDNDPTINNNGFLAPPNEKDDQTKLISRSNSIENLSIFMYSDESNLNEEDQKFIRRCGEAVPRNIILIREYFLPNGKKYNTIGRSLSTLKITDMVTNGHSYHDIHDANSLGRRSVSDKSIDSLHDELDESSNDAIPKPHSPTTTEEKSYEEEQFINIVLKQLLV